MDKKKNKAPKTKIDKEFVGVDLSSESVTYDKLHTLDKLVTSSNNTYTITNTAANTITTSSNIIWTPQEVKYNCNCCNKEFTETSGYYTIINGTIVYPGNIHYKGPKFERHICSTCNGKALDKLFGIDSKAEYTIY